MPIELTVCFKPTDYILSKLPFLCNELNLCICVLIFSEQ